MHLAKKLSSILGALVLINLGCQRQIKTGPSVLVIGIEGLSGVNFSCSAFEENQASGFQVLCNEAVRFTHAFTTSPLAQAGLGSILTGQLPIQNGLRDNGRTALPAKTITLAERLIMGKALTFFVASGPTVKRSSRLNQGFETFNDDYELTYKQFYRPLSESVTLFKTWLDTEVDHDSFFGVIHVSDLLFPQVITQTDLLEPRPRGLEGQLEEIDENLYALFSILKKNKLWGQTYIVLVGLNGISNAARINELSSTNLFVENVAVPLFIKPLKGREEIPHQWKIDSHVSFHDVGVTLEDIFNSPGESKGSDTTRGISLLPLLNGKSNPLLNSRSLLIESAWGEWALGSAPRISIRDQQWLIIFDKKPLLYNSLTDRNEINRVSLKEGAYQDTIDNLRDQWENLKFEPFEKPPIHFSEEFRFAQILVENEGRPIDSFLNELKPYLENNPSSETIQWLMIDQLLRQKKWALVEDFNAIWENELLEQVLDLKNGEQLGELSHPCLWLLSTKLEKLAGSNKRRCQSNDFMLLYDFLNAPIGKKESLLEKFAVVARHQALQLKMIYYDLSRGGVVFGANTQRLKDLMLFRLVLSLPSYQKDATLLEKHLAN